MTLTVIAVIAVMFSAFSLLLTIIVLVKVSRLLAPPLHVHVNTPPAPELEPIDEPPFKAPKPLWP